MMSFSLQPKPLHDVSCEHSHPCHCLNHLRPGIPSIHFVYHLYDQEVFSRSKSGTVSENQMPKMICYKSSHRSQDIEMIVCDGQGPSRPKTPIVVARKSNVEDEEEIWGGHDLGEEWHKGDIEKVDMEIVREVIDGIAEREGED